MASLFSTNQLAARVRAAREAATGLAARDPANTGWQRDLSVSHEKIGDVLAAQGDGAGALQADRKSLAICEGLTTRNPANTDWQRGLSVSHIKFGDVLVGHGDGAGALQAYRKSHAIAEALAVRDPSNAGWQRDLMVSYCRMAQSAETTDPATAPGWWRKAYEQLDGMKRRGIMNPTDERYLATLREKAAIEPAAPPTAQQQ